MLRFLLEIIKGGFMKIKKSSSQKVVCADEAISKLNLQNVDLSDQNVSKQQKNNFIKQLKGSIRECKREKFRAFFRPTDKKSLNNINSRLENCKEMLKCARRYEVVEM